jgi:peroxiredoxin
MHSRLLGLALLGGMVTAQAEGSEDAHDAERRIILYVQENLKPGQPLVLSKLYNEVFTSPEERKVLDKLNRAFFRIPLFLIEYQATEERMPSLQEIAGQFDFYGPDEAKVVLAVMESDPRVPKFIRRDPDSGEVVRVDVEMVKKDPRFNKLLDRSLVGWEGEPAPAIRGRDFEGQELGLASLRGKAVLLYVWFTNCPPCLRLTPDIAALHEQYRLRGFTVLGVNADRILGLPYDDEVRSEYLRKHSITYPNIHMTEEARAALGNVNIFPTLFLIDPQGTIAKYYVNYQRRDALAKDIEKILAPGQASSSRE